MFFQFVGKRLEFDMSSTTDPECEEFVEHVISREETDVVLFYPHIFFCYGNFQYVTKHGSMFY